MRIYLDHNATSPLTERTRTAMTEAMAVAGNPSSVHGDGRAARARLETARAGVAALAGVEPDQLVLTSGGTEADLLGVVGLARAARAAGAPARALVLATEHPAVHGAAATLAAEGFAVAALPVDRAGRVDLDGLDAALAGGAAVVAVAAVNHETGVIADLDTVAARCRAAGARLHVDAVQAAGRIALAPIAALADAMALSAHKIGGPAGVGALIVRAGVELAPLHAAGHQERGRRPGTENLLGAIGFAAAASEVDLTAVAAVARRAARLEAGLLTIAGARIHGGGAPRTGTTVNVGFEGALGEAIVIALDLAGVSASTGAACTSGSIQPSPVLLALGLSRERAREGVRFSLGVTTTDADIDRVLEVLPAIVERARRA
ncbi:MAG TPA: cysteine desulfurase family protein [Kofleriaceae bacterium]|nr:cysteine desulfurase family protein [Kofleriaceae bacterium]